jgi:hypothetical protein
MPSWSPSTVVVTSHTPQPLAQKASINKATFPESQRAISTPGDHLEGGDLVVGELDHKMYNFYYRFCLAYYIRIHHLFQK